MCWTSMISLLARSPWAYQCYYSCYTAIIPSPFTRPFIAVVEMTQYAALQVHSLFLEMQIVQRVPLDITVLMVNRRQNVIQVSVL